jgi:hypothetical protein
MSTRKRKAPSRSSGSPSPSDLPDYLDYIERNKFPELPKLPKKNWGDSSNDIISVDESIKVVLLIAQIVNKNFLVLKEPIILPGTEEEIDDSIAEILKEIENKERIYFCVNAACERSLSHQNWVCITKNPKEIIRFEPSRDYPQYCMAEFCKKFKGYTYKINEKEHGLNQINACRLNSTILAVNHILGFSIDRFLAFFDFKKFSIKHIEKLRKFNYKVNQDFEQFLFNNPISFTRKSDRLDKKYKKSLFKSIRKLKKSVRKLKKSFRKIKNKS